jgi:regulator of RNase E activity RraA
VRPRPSAPGAVQCARFGAVRAVRCSARGSVQCGAVRDSEASQQHDPVVEYGVRAVRSCCLAATHLGEHDLPPVGW